MLKIKYYKITLVIKVWVRIEKPPAVIGEPPPMCATDSKRLYLQGVQIRGFPPP